ncbi:YeeE/YedE family protein [Shewanella sp. OMA3-2]|uniref:YeeE/YedE family protein n=1 Tax=Shewanella sp. OMA3-2 TaxID=2908650 RepID=UPI001F1D4091|nr:YeeE/YedE family protein [Shewanella sp. OMA3-2]UJF22628.1 YeeE/YedE family protein [Shewanella sp. OMA3-2]
MSQYRHSPSLIRALVAFIAGSLFGLGLTVTQMVDANKVLNFLDVFGQWDPSLAIVMAAGLSVFSIGYMLLVKPKSKPLLDNQFFLPTKKHIDRKLLIGACLFGLGWGLVGICPGPAIVNLANLDGKFIGFVIAMLVGMFIGRKLPLKG